MHDDTLPDVPQDDYDPSPALDVHAYRASKGQILRDGVVFDAERDYFTRSVLLAQVKELYGLLHDVTAERDHTASTCDAVIESYRALEAIAEKAFTECERLSAERDALETELASMRDAVKQINERPVASALLLLASTLFGTGTQHNGKD